MPQPKFCSARNQNTFAWGRVPGPQWRVLRTVKRQIQWLVVMESTMKFLFDLYLIKFFKWVSQHCKWVYSVVVLLPLLVSCGELASKNRAVYLLLDTSGTYTEEMDKAQAIINYLLSTLDSGDSIAVARIDSGSFSEKDIIAKVTFDDRPSITNDQKRLFKQQINHFVANIPRGSANTDITGGVIQAADFVTETQAGDRLILIFSDLEEDLAKGHVRDFPIDVTDIKIVALNVTKLGSDNIDPRDYTSRLKHWQQRVVDGGGEWQVLNDLERMDRLVSRR